MQSQRKNPGSYFGRQHSNCAFNTSKSNIVKKKSSVAVQTENFPNFGELCDFSIESISEIKVHYHTTLQFLNNCHQFINRVFGDSFRPFGDSGEPKPFDFRVPEVPDYFSVLEMFMEQCRTSNPAFEPQSNTKDSQLEIEEQTVFDLQQFLPRNVGDGPGQIKKTQERENYVLGRKNKRSVSPSRLVKSEKDILRKPSHHDLKALSTTFEEILKTCNEFENKSIEYLLRNDVPLNEPAILPRNFEDKITLENLEQGDQEQNQCRRSDWHEGVINNNAKGFNLLEYALKNCTPLSKDPDSPPATPPSPKHQPPETLGHLAENLPNLLFNFQGVVTNTRKSLTILNAASQCQSPKRVNDMFRKISREYLESSDANEEFVRFLEDDYDGLSEQGSEGNCQAEYASSESIILTDDEFQKRTKANSLVLSEEKLGVGKRMPRKEGKLRDCFLVETQAEQKPIKANPFKLNEKDKSLADEKVLRTIGLFNEKGDIRPGVISILEEKQRLSLTENKAKNVQFRTERKYDLEVRFNNNNNMRQTDNTSEEALLGNNDNVCLEQTRDTNSSVVSLSTCSTISDSDILNTKPNDNKSLIKKDNN